MRSWWGLKTTTTTQHVPDLSWVGAKGSWAEVVGSLASCCQEGLLKKLRKAALDSDVDAMKEPWNLPVYVFLQKRFLCILCTRKACSASSGLRAHLGDQRFWICCLLFQCSGGVRSVHLVSLCATVLIYCSVEKATKHVQSNQSACDIITARLPTCFWHIPGERVWGFLAKEQFEW